MREGVRELVEASRLGDEAAFARLVTLFRAEVLQLARRVLRDGDEAEDAAQEAFTTAFRRLGDLREPERFPAWLGALATNAARKQAARRAMERGRVVRL